MEQQLSLEETAHFRVAIAARHSKRIKDDPAILWHAFHAVDAILSNLGMIQLAIASRFYRILRLRLADTFITSARPASTFRQNETLALTYLINLLD